MKNVFNNKEVTLSYENIYEGGRPTLLSHMSAFKESRKNYRKYWIQTKENIGKNAKEYPSIKVK